MKQLIYIMPNIAAELVLEIHSIERITKTF